MEETTKHCARCGTGFKPVRSTHVYCGPNCRSKTRHYHGPVYHEKNCAYCGKDMITTRSRRRFCTATCRESYYAESKSIHVRKKGQYIKECARCGKEFSTSRPKFRFCGDICHFEHTEDIRQSKLVTKPCAHCGTVFTTERKSKRFCDNSCAGKYHSEKAKRKKAEAGRKENRKHAPRNKPVEKVCEHCGKSYKTIRLEQKHCSAHCAISRQTAMRKQSGQNPSDPFTQGKHLPLRSKLKAISASVEIEETTEIDYAKSPYAKHIEEFLKKKPAKRIKAPDKLQYHYWGAVNEEEDEYYTARITVGEIISVDNSTAESTNKNRKKERKAN